MKKKNILIIVLCVVIVGLLSVIAYFVVNNTQEKKANNTIVKPKNDNIILCVTDSIRYDWDCNGYIVRLQEFNNLNDIINDPYICAWDKRYKETDNYKVKNNYKLDKKTKYISISYWFKFKNEVNDNNNPMIFLYLKEDAFKWNKNKDTIFISLSRNNILGHQSTNIQHIKIRD